MVRVGGVGAGNSRFAEEIVAFASGSVLPVAAGEPDRKWGVLKSMS